MERLLCMTLLLTPLWWVLGATALIYHLCALAIGVVWATPIDRHEKIVVPPTALFPLAYAGIYAFSLAANAPSAETDRAIASAYNLSFWVMGFFVIVAATNANWWNMLRTIRTFAFYVAWITGFSAVIALVAWETGMREWSLPSVLGLFLGDLPFRNANATLQLSFLSSDWISGSLAPRIFVLAPYPTALAATLMFAASALLATSFRPRAPKLIVLLALSMMLVGFYLTMSRITIVAFGLSLLVTTVLFSRRLTIAVPFLAAGCVLAVYPMLSALDFLLELRSGSTEHRLYVYQRSIEIAWETNPLLGLGFKPYVFDLNVALGSHSTYVGALLKTGLLGTACIVIWQIFVVSRIVSTIRKVVHARISGNLRAALFILSVPLIAMPIWLLTEDADAAQLVAFLHFTFLGCFESLCRTEELAGATVKRAAPPAHAPLTNA